ncbi:MAG: GNAT family N-acetyltransferase [Verrucomicrobiaceae bacterium]|nr:GNAT family N-acetyltransferase [Verrucomicrobiaceae bacterium]
MTSTPATSPSASGGSIKIRRVRDDADWAALGAHWDELLHDSEADAVFLCRDWIDTWLKVYGSGGERVILVAEDETGALLGIAPMMLDRGAGRLGRWVRRLLLVGQKADTASEYLDWIIRRGREQDVGDALARHVTTAMAHEWDVLCFDAMLSTSATIETLRRHFDGGLSVKPLTNAPYVTLAATWDGFLEQKRAKFRQRLNKFHREHRVRVLLGGHDIGVDEGMAVIRRLNEQRWGDARRSFLSERYRRFHDEVAARLHERGRLLLIFLEVDGTIIAGRYDFAYGGKGWSFQGGWLPEWEKLSAGKLMLAEIMRWCIEHGLREYDFLGGAAAYKTDWSNGERTLVTLDAANPRSTRGKLWRLLREAKQKLTAKLRA